MATKKRKKTYRPRSNALLSNVMAVVSIDEYEDVNDRIRMMYFKNLVTTNVIEERDFASASLCMMVAYLLSTGYEGEWKSFFKAAHEALRSMHIEWVEHKAIKNQNDLETVAKALTIADLMRQESNQRQISEAVQYCLTALHLPESHVGKRLRFEYLNEVYPEIYTPMIENAKRQAQ